MSISDQELRSRDLSIDRYKIEKAEVRGEWKGVSNIKVLIKDVQTGSETMVHALKYGWLYKYVTSNVESKDTSLENLNSTIHGASVDGVIIAFGKRGQERFESTVELLKMGI